MSGNQAIAISWLSFLALLGIWGGMWVHVAVPISAALIWLFGIWFILRRKKV